jgi:hypothetical protein
VKDEEKRSRKTHPNAIVDLVKTDFTASNVTAGETKVAHASEGEFAEVTVLNAGRNEGHGNVAVRRNMWWDQFDSSTAAEGRREGETPDAPLNTIHPRPRGHQRQNPCHDIDQSIRAVVLVPPRSPELVQSRTANDERRVDLETVGAERGVFEVFVELGHVALDADVGEVGLCCGIVEVKKWMRWSGLTRRVSSGQT